jgi:hypothetical protein
MFPPLWPWKVVSLPFRGPRPTLKGEEPLQLRLMDDIVIPRSLAQFAHTDRPPYARSSSFNATPAVTDGVQLAVATRTMTTVANTQVAAIATAPAAAVTVPTPANLQVRAALPSEVQPSARFTVLVLNSNQLIEVNKYHREGDLLIIQDVQGRTGSLNMSDVDWTRTSEMTGKLRSVDTPLISRQLN